MKFSSVFVASIIGCILVVSADIVQLHSEEANVLVADDVGLVAKAKQEQLEVVHNHDDNEDPHVAQVPAIFNDVVSEHHPVIDEHGDEKLSNSKKRVVRQVDESKRVVNHVIHLRLLNILDADVLAHYCNGDRVCVQRTFAEMMLELRALLRPLKIIIHEVNRVSWESHGVPRGDSITDRFSKPPWPYWWEAHQTNISVHDIDFEAMILFSGRLITPIAGPQEHQMYVPPEAAGNICVKAQSVGHIVMENRIRQRGDVPAHAAKVLPGELAYLGARIIGRLLGMKYDNRNLGICTCPGTPFLFKPGQQTEHVCIMHEAQFYPPFNYPRTFSDCSIKRLNEVVPIIMRNHTGCLQAKWPLQSLTRCSDVAASGGRGGGGRTFSYRSLAGVGIFAFVLAIVAVVAFALFMVAKRQ